MFIACLFKGSQEQSFFLQTLLFTAFLATVLKILTYAFVSTWSLVSSAWEHVKRKMHSWYPCASMSQLLSYLEGLGSVIFKCLNNSYVLSFSTSLSCFQYIRGEHENARFKEMMKVASFPSPVGIPLTLGTKCKLLSFLNSHSQIYLNPKCTLIHIHKNTQVNAPSYSHWTSSNSKWIKYYNTDRLS